MERLPFRQAHRLNCGHIKQRETVESIIPAASVRADQEWEKPGPDKVQTCKHSRLLNKEMKEHSEGS